MRVLNYVKEDHQFYPTPPALADYIRNEYVKLNKVKILDPSAGKGDLLIPYYNCDLYAVEIDPHLQTILRSKGIAVIGEDWMKYDGTDIFDFVVMNPPFRYAEDHFIKAIEHFKLTNTHIICIMNAETVRNPTIRMQDYLNKFNISIEYKENAFSNAERKTNVEIAICSIKMRNENHMFDDIIDKLEFSKDVEEDVIDQCTGVEKRNSVDIVREVNRYKEDVENTKKVYSLFNKVMSKTTGVPFTLYMNCGEEVASLSKAIKSLRQRYWHSIIEIEAFSKRMTYDDTWKMREFLSENDTLEFSIDNVYTLLQKTIKTAQESVEKTAMELFNSITNLHAYNVHRKNNVHLYDGWKTNEGVAVKKKFIIPVYTGLGGEPVTDYESGRLDFKVERKLKDIEMVISYFHFSRVKDLIFNGNDTYMNYYIGDSTYENNLLHIKLYKKGTAHITVKDEDTLRRFNIFAGKRIGALPYDYGEKPVNEMSSEELRVSKSFEGNKYKADVTVPLLGV